MLKFETEAVPEGLENYYQKDDTSGKFRLKVEGVVPEAEHRSIKDKVNSFRNDNVALKRQLEELVDFESVVTGTDGKVTKDGVKNTIETLVQNRVAQMKHTLETQIAEKDEALRKTSTKLEDVLIADVIKSAALTHAVIPGGIEDVMYRARKQFKIDNGNVVSVNAAGDANGNPLTIDSFVAGLKQTAPHLFAKSEGTGTFNRTRTSQPTQGPEVSRALRLQGFAKKP